MPSAKPTTTTYLNPSFRDEAKSFNTQSPMFWHGVVFSRWSAAHESLGGLLSVTTNNPTLEALNQLVLELNVRWQMFDELYSDAKNYAVLNRSGANFWATLENLLIDDLMLSISRFLDPPQSMGQSNCSLAAIAALPENAAFRNDLQKQLDALVPVWAKGIRNWRHKKLSHSDLATVLGTNVLPDIPFSEIKSLVDGITAFVREIEHQLNHRDISYRCSLTGISSLPTRAMRS
jgi:hypothetical protein